ncbi:MAG: signal peptidase I [Acidimicrobiia bacterium]|nr:signal peptidase I [Acidimicrobiia bacterium]
MVDERVSLPDTVSGPAPKSEKPKPSALRGTVEWVVILVGALLVALVVKTFLLQAFYIPSASMEPTLNIKDRVLVNKLSYDFHDVRRGDIVVFRSPPGEGDPEIKDLIKRVIGLPDETVEGHDGRVFINGDPLKEPYLPEGVSTSSFPPQKIPSGHLWMMGDNRSNSKDSRVFGPINDDLVVGRAFILVWPLGSIRLL